jgi:hypothetical protein
MRKTYILSHNSKFGTHEEIVAFINSCELIRTWRRELPFCYFLVSESSAEEICVEIRKQFSNVDGDTAYLVAELNANCQGLLEDRSWFIINEHKLPPKEPVKEAK